MLRRMWLLNKGDIVSGPEWLNYIFANLAVTGMTGAGIAGLLIWFWKTWISEQIKGLIKHQHDLEIEQVKFASTVAAAERVSLLTSA